MWDNKLLTFIDVAMILLAFLGLRYWKLHK